MIRVILVSLLVLGFSACDDSKNTIEKINTEKKVKLPKPIWEDRLTNYKNTGMWYQQADDNAIAASNIAVIYSEKIKDYKKAIEWYLYSNSIKESADNLFGLALVFDDIKNYKDAIKYYKKSYLLEFKEETISNLALLYKKELQDYKEAELWYKKGIEREYTFNKRYGKPLSL